jgi:tetratricopeptide (TPR) repeat protein
MSEKIRDCYSDINALHNQIMNDIEFTVEKPLRWDRSMNFFTMLHTQQLESRYSIIKVSNDTPHDEYIVIFHCDDRNISNAYHGTSPLYHSTNTKECLEFINKQTISQIFLIISGSIIPSEIQSVFDYQHIHAIYFFPNNELQYSINNRKVSGFFDKLDDLFEQLHKDIQFYREQHFHTSRIDTFSRIIQKQKLISQLTDKQSTFLTYNLFIDILPLVPILEFKLDDITQICDILFPNQSTDIAHYIHQLQDESYYTKNYIQNPKFSQIILRLHQMNKINELFILQKQFVDIEKQVHESTAISTLDSVYITRMITTDTLKLMQSSIDEYISIGIFVLATKSLLTARTIARKLVDNGLISILFYIEILKSTRLLNIDFDRVLFHPGAVFGLRSIDRAPDNVFYVKLKAVDKEFYFIKEQLQFEIDVKLSWLTYGNYLYFLNRFKEGETYFNYLLNKLSSEHFYVLAIHNNMGLLYAKKYEEGEDKEQYFHKAEMAFNTIVEKFSLIDSSSAIRSNVDQLDTEIDGAAPTFNTIDYITIVGHIADLYYIEKEYEKAMESYIKALELSVDKRACCYYRKMILTIKEHLKE